MTLKCRAFFLGHLVGSNIIIKVLVSGGGGRRGKVQEMAL